MRCIYRAYCLLLIPRLYEKRLLLLLAYLLTLPQPTRQKLTLKLNAVTHQLC